MKAPLDKESATIDALARCPHAGLKHTVDLLDQARRSQEASRLIELGARASLASQLTGLPKKTVNRLYRQLTGRPSPSGQSFFSDFWYIRQTHRMLHAAVVWNLYQRHPVTGCSRARVLLDIYDVYQRIIDEPLLSLPRAHFVLVLIATRSWEARRCRDCRSTYLAPVDQPGTTCPGCIIYFQYRCHRCGAAMTAHATGRRRKTCGACVASKT